MIDLLWIAGTMGGFTVLCMIPLLCTLDIKHREVPDKIWLIAAVPNIVALGILYSHGLPVGNLLISLGMATIYLILRKAGMFGGADAKFLIFIALFVIFNPVNFQQAYFQLWIYVCLCIAMLGATIFMKSRWYDKTRGFPHMITISAGFIMAMLWGIPIIT
jgi:Flp pilus assembly protein protease CpaA